MDLTPSYDDPIGLSAERHDEIRFRAEATVASYTTGLYRGSEKKPNLLVFVIVSLRCTLMAGSIRHGNLVESVYVHDLHRQYLNLDNERLRMGRVRTTSMPLDR